MPAIYENQINVKVGPFEHFGLATFFVYILLVGFGLISIYSATYEAGMSTFFFKQLSFVVLGTAVMFITMFLPLRWLNAYSHIAYALSLLLLVLVLLFGKEISGTKGWFAFGGFGIQPAEPAKLTTLLAASRFLSLKGTDIRRVRDLGILLIIVLLPVGLILFQPDFGTATVFFAILLGVLLWVGFDIFILYIALTLPIIFITALIGNTYFIVSLIIFSIITLFFRKKIIVTVLAASVIFLVGFSSPHIFESLKPHQKARIESFLRVGSGEKGMSYNVVQSTLAVGSGGLTGKGFLKGTQTQLRYIPAQRTDFILCVTTEEFGFLGGSLVIVLIAALIFRALKISAESNSRFLSIVSFGVASIFLYHSFFNIGMVIGLMPVMGIPLPFLSYGGSALITNSAMVGFMLNAYRLKRVS
ncbi:MAG: rod shape-determining protein RodA [Ignavibacteria bacterium]|nr:rod shape-determining protein RodA [Ignavibacteria bacterium]